MKYTTEPPVDEKNKNLDPTVHVLGQTNAAPPSAVTGAVTDTGPQPEQRFPSTDEWAGKPMTGDYQTIPEEKDAIERNLRKAGEEIQTRFGLETRGVPVTQAETDQTIKKDTA
jgi:hypothetical protein